MNVFKKRNGMISYVKQKEALCALLREAHKTKECFDAEGKSLGECKTPIVPLEHVDSLAAYLLHHTVKVVIK